jgi:hypothetical protein
MFPKRSKKAQVAFVAVMLGVVVILLGLSLTPGLFEVTNSSEVMGEDGLNCSSDTITNQDKANCTSIDATPMVFGFVLFGLAIMLLRRILV